MSRFDEVTGKHFNVNNQTGLRKRVNPLGQNLEIYDLNISGVAETKARNVLAGDVKLQVTCSERSSSTGSLRA